MITPREALIEIISKRTFEEILNCMDENAEGEEVIQRTATIIKLELDKCGIPYTEEEIRGIAVLLGIQFVECLLAERAINDEPDTLH